MKLLIIGGTGFLGSHLAEAALARGYELTLFNRGQRNPHLFPDVEQLHGNRDGTLTMLEGRQWDVVIDTCGYVPRIVRMSSQALADTVERYIFVSSISVYEDFSQSESDESLPVGTLQDESVEEISEETYGPLKALCEQAAEQVMPGRVLIIRPGLIVGPRDLSDRFTYWPYRVAQGGEVLVPGKPEQPVQFIDARDLAVWTIQMAEARKTGIYNATGPDSPLSMQHFLDECKAATGSNAHFVWVSESFLSEREVTLPLWVPQEDIGFQTINCRKALHDGLAFRALADTIKDTLAWKGNDKELRTGLQPDQEKQLLQAWQESVKAS